MPDLSFASQDKGLFMEPTGYEGWTVQTRSMSGAPIRHSIITFVAPARATADDGSSHPAFEPFKGQDPAIFRFYYTYVWGIRKEAFLWFQLRRNVGLALLLGIIPTILLNAVYMYLVWLFFCFGIHIMAGKLNLCEMLFCWYAPNDEVHCKADAAHKTIYFPQIASLAPVFEILHPAHVNHGGIAILKPVIQSECPDCGRLELIISQERAEINSLRKILGKAQQQLDLHLTAEETALIKSKTAQVKAATDFATASQQQAAVRAGDLPAGKSEVEEVK